MLQAVVKKGKVVAENVPSPFVSDGCLLIKVVNSCISAGTEMTSVTETSKPLIKRAMEQPEQVKTVLEFARKNGIKKTVARVKGTLDGGKPTGYSISGVVIGIGKGVKDYVVGDPVAAAGAGLANHAELVDVPQNLVMKMPKGMDFKTASTVTLGGIAMQGIRRCEMTLGETAVVVGAGILGLLAQQMLQLSGVRTIVLDLDPNRLKVAKELGAELVLNPKDDDTVKVVQNFTGGYGADAVLFAAATSSSGPLSDSFQMCKKKGRVVLVGVSGMEIKRGDIYRKELDFLISTSYGPGRYDVNYEAKGLDYPFAYVRWTENRNMTEYLRLVHTGKVNLDLLINAVYPIEKVEEAYADLKSGEGPKPIISLLDYGELDIQKLNLGVPESRKIIVSPNFNRLSKDVIQVALVGSGGFATGMHLPNIQSLSKKFQLRAVVNRTGQKAVAVSKQYNAEYVTTDFEDVINDENIDLVLISTRHDSHSDLTLRALEAGKNVFVEKPLAINEGQLEKIIQFYESGTENKPLLMVGFNRRFSKYLQEIKRHTSKRINPLLIHYRMNAGFIPLDHWVHEDGGRIIGEACHIVDIMNFLTESEVVSIESQKISPHNSKFSSDDNRAILLKYADGSVCTIHYFAVGSKQVSKEFLEVHFDEKTIVMEDYKSLKGYGVKVKNISSSISQKGQLEELEFLYESLKNGDKWPIDLWDMVQTTEICFAINSQ